MGLTIEEQETNINWGRGDKRTQIYVSDTTMMTKLDKLIKLPNTEWKLEEEIRLQRTGELVGKRYSCPVEFISFRTKRRELSEEAKKKAGSRITEYNKTREL